MCGVHSSLAQVEASPEARAAREELERKRNEAGNDP